MVVVFAFVGSVLMVSVIVVVCFGGGEGKGGCGVGDGVDGGNSDVDSEFEGVGGMDGVCTDVNCGRDVGGDDVSRGGCIGGDSNFRL